MRGVMCVDCDDRADMAAALARVEAGEADPPCRSCGGILKATTILFGESLVEADVVAAQEAAQRGDLVLAVGTTLNVYPAAHGAPHRPAGRGPAGDRQRRADRRRRAAPTPSCGARSRRSSPPWSVAGGP